MSRIGIKVLAKLNRETSASLINQDIKAIEPNLDPVKLKASLVLDPSQIQAIQQQLTGQVEQTQDKLKTRTKVRMKDSMFVNPVVERQAIDSITSRMDEIRANVDELGKVSTDYWIDKKGNMGIARANLSYYNKELGQTLTETMSWHEESKKVNDEIVKIREFRSDHAKGTDDLSRRAANVERERATLYGQMNKHIKEKYAIKNKIITAEGRAKAILRTRLAHVQGLIKANAKEITQKGLQKNAEKHIAQSVQARNKLQAEHNFQLAKAQQKQRGLAAATGAYGNKVGVAGHQWNKMAAQMGMLENLVIAMKRIPIWMIGMTAFYAPIRSFRQGIQDLVEIDKHLVELRKVSGGATDVIKEFGREATEMGARLGRSTQEVVQASTEFARLGYSIQEASELAEESLILSNVGNMEVQQASKGIISTIKAFRYEVDDTRHVIDLINETGNNFAISQEGIVESLQRSSASMEAAGNTLEETLALTASINEIIQDPKVVGTALRTVSIILHIVALCGNTQRKNLFNLNYRVYGQRLIA